MRNKNTYNNRKVRRDGVGTGKNFIKNNCVSTAASYHRPITSARMKNGRAVTRCQLNRCSCSKNQHLQDTPELLQKHLLRTNIFSPETEDETSLVTFFCKRSCYRNTHISEGCWWPDASKICRCQVMSLWRMHEGAGFF